MVEFIEIRAKSILNKYKKIDSWFQVRYSMNIYRGCEHGCIYCDGRSNCYWKDGGNEDFSKKIYIKTNAAYLLTKELSRIKQRQPIAVGGGVTDVYQGCEEKYELTRKCLQILARNNYPSHLMTKSALILRDIDLLKQLSENNWFFTSISFSTISDSIATIFEPRCSRPSVRLKVVKKLNEEGVKTGITYMPILPYITDSEEHIRECLKEFKKAGAVYVISASLTLRDFQQNYFMKVLASHYPSLVPKYNKLYKSGYFPTKEYTKQLKSKVEGLCNEIGIPTKIPRFVPHEKYIQKKIS